MSLWVMVWVAVHGTRRRARVSGTGIGGVDENVARLDCVGDGQVGQGDVAGVGDGQGVGDDLADRVVVGGVRVDGLVKASSADVGGLDACRGVRGASVSVLVAWPVSVNEPASRSAWVIA